MEFIETSLFTKRICKWISDDEYRKIQHSLIFRPDAGKIITGSGGLRKIRWNIRGGGKRGGLRLIYYWDKPAETFYMLYVFRKNKQEDLTPDQLNILRKLIKELLQ